MIYSGLTLFGVVIRYDAFIAGIGNVILVPAWMGLVALGVGLFIGVVATALFVHDRRVAKEDAAERKAMEDELVALRNEKRMHYIPTV